MKIARERRNEWKEKFKKRDKKNEENGKKREREIGGKG